MENKQEFVPEQGNEDEPIIYGIHIDEDNLKHFSRRDFLKTATIAGTAIALSSCEFLEGDNANATKIAELEQKVADSESTMEALEQNSSSTETGTGDSSNAKGTTFSDAYLYAGPDDSFDTIVRISDDVEVTILAQDPSGKWYLIETSAGKTGWVLASKINVVSGTGDIPVDRNAPTPKAPTATKTQTQIPTATEVPPTATTKPTSTPEDSCKGVVNTAHTIWEGPNSNHPSLGKTKKGEEVEIIGKTEDNAWFKIYTSDGTIGWCYATFIDLKTCELWEIKVPYSIPTEPAPPCDCDAYGACDCDSYEACSCDAYEYEYCTCDTVHYWYPN